MNTEKLEKLKKSLDNKFIPDNMKDKIREEIKKLESEIKTDDNITPAEVKEEIKEIEEKVEEALEVAEKKEEQAEVKAEEKKEKAPRKPREKKATQSETKTQKAKKKSVFSIAKEIRKDGESWEDAKNRATKMMKSETTETKKKVRTETDKLLAMVRRNKEYKKLVGTSNLSKDASRRALPRGKRVSENGKVYYENRANRVDVGGFKGSVYLAEGGVILDGVKVEVYKGFHGLKAENYFDNINGYDWNIVTMKRHSGELVSSAKAGKTTKSDGDVEMFTFDWDSPNIKLVSSRPSRVTEKVIEIQHSQALQIFKEKMEQGNYADGGSIIGTPETPLDRGLGMNYTTLVGETSAMSSGEMFAGGGVVKINIPTKVQKKFSKEQERIYDFYVSHSNNLIDAIDDLKRAKRRKDNEEIKRLNLKILNLKYSINFIASELKKDEKLSKYIEGVKKIDEDSDAFAYGGYAKDGVYVETLDEKIDLTDDGKPKVKKTQEGKKMSEAEWMEKYNDSMEARTYAEGGFLGEVAFEVINDYVGNLFLGVYNVSINKEYNSSEVFMKYSEAVQGLLEYLKSEDGNFLIKEYPKSKFEIVLVSYNSKLDKYNDFEPQRKVVFSLKSSMVKDFLEKEIFEQGGQLEIKYAEGGSLGNHGLKQGDQILKTMSGGVQKVKTKSGDIVYVNLANGYRGDVPPMPFDAGGRLKSAVMRDRNNVNYSEDYEVRYSKDKPHRSGYTKPKMSRTQFEDESFEFFKKGGVTKNYINRKDLNTITIKKGDQKLTYKVSDVYNGAYKLEDGGNLEKTAFYVSKRNVVKVQLKDGKDVKVANGYWIKKNAKPIHTSKFDNGGNVSDLDNRYVYVSYEGQPSEAGETKKIVSYKYSDPKFNKKTLTLKFGDGSSLTLEKEISDFEKGKEVVVKSGKQYVAIELLDEEKLEGGGKIINNEPKEEDLITNVGKYGSRITKVTDSYVEFWDNTSMRKISCKKSDLVLNNIDEDGDDDGYYEDEPNSWICKKTSYAGGGKTTFKEKATAIAKNFEGKKVEPKYQKEYGKTYDKAEAKEVGNKIAGSQKAKYDSKMSGGGSTTKRGGAMVLAKQIRKEGESWQSALKRANEQLSKK